MRLIDADALLPMMKYATIDNEIGVFPIKIGFNAIAKVINEAPTVDAEPVRHGKWIKHMKVVHHEDFDSYTPWWQCSECGQCYDPTFANICNYCYYCGAKMDGEREEE